MEKKPEENWEESEQLGPYQLREQVPQVELRQGSLYRATHETSGATALVFKPAARDEGGPSSLTDWRVYCISSASAGYLALEVEHSSWSVAPDMHSVESLVCTFEEVRDGVERMAHALRVSDAPRSRRHLGFALAGVAAVGALVFALVRMTPVFQAPVSSSQGVMADTEMLEPFISGLADTTSPGVPMLARPLPPEPFKGQKRPPCTRYAEVELNGACWMPHELKAPCPDVLFEHQGKCYAPAYSAKPPPSSLGQ